MMFMFANPKNSFLCPSSYFRRKIVILLPVPQIKYFRISCFEIVDTFRDSSPATYGAISPSNKVFDAHSEYMVQSIWA